ncbi:hypothetical protein BCR42DRAFT_152725 [Absidia repens]|uniref:Heterokaryon incompatibility domain-containing protein n=1 Tax=Absidia repens TaxID=90262 RepID=A0A1X2I1L0_9FUNG|nr:hypothetical protein BCR42DRAFT_152725 [Absidia repens]
MTKDDPVDLLYQELSCDNTQQPQQQQKPLFHVVLVDIQNTVKHNTVHCVEKPLEGDTEELSFVALSYRWGEVQEQLIDTRLGYVASVTSFALMDFYKLCSLMMEEPDLKSIKYVWVDAICVDQTNYERRKATIHQISNIYEHATYILAVPDLHKQHLINVSKANFNIINKLLKYDRYLYYLIHGNIDKLVQLDKTFLDEIEVPNDQVLRQLVTKYSLRFMDAHNTNLTRDPTFEAELAVEELYNISRTSLYTTFKGLFCRSNRLDLKETWKSRAIWYGKKDKYGFLILPWKSYVVKRSRDVAQAMEFLNDLIKDWSSRVWVISEYHIAKKKNNLKYCFMALFQDYGWERKPFF